MEEIRADETFNYAQPVTKSDADTVANLKMELSVARTENHNLRLEIESLLALKEELDSIKTKFRSDLQKEEFSHRKVTFDDMERQLEEKRAEIVDLVSTVSKQDFQLEKLRHMNEQLQAELETVPSYIEKYHQERRLLRQKSGQKDRLIRFLVEKLNSFGSDVLLTEENPSNIVSSASISNQRAESMGTEELSSILIGSSAPEPKSFPACTYCDSVQQRI